MEDCMRKLVSIVIPCYRSAEMIGGVVADINREMEKLQEKYRWEIILVNDCSPDNTFDVIREICREYTNICGINLARNFGQHAALMAGFHQVKGDILVCMDDDGQTPAFAIKDLLQGLEEGSDVVYAKYEHKHHNAFRNFGSRVNDLMLKFMLGKPADLYVSSFFAARRFIVDEMLRYQNAYPYVIGLVLRATRNIKNVTVEHQDRKAGESGYTLSKLLGLWFNGFTAFSEKPLRVATMIGTGCAFLGFLYGLYTIIKKLVNPMVPIGFSSLMSALMFIGGMLMLMVGLVGEYIGRMYICMNNAPQYVVREIVGEEEGEKDTIQKEETVQKKQEKTQEQ
ncbi:glycosyltransferase family 2 protein [Eisenbergiella tayi]|uniref:Undecaprenyl-phosphate 4-deoxy-4-formamido-L-arabinose transferase n=1 Tax=Eisenbergiella tayi TaxID=1432052 RepID=A0A1E3A9U7_9FIRM|nr:glycosyltransferase family 2 protein [Eisenbergiella tayi]ODM05544.1 Undecaprenyl-phosphate 4-deoxy-4-formamido-L-arabinose transferase [Eisenbergiella tayi]